VVVPVSIRRSSLCLPMTGQHSPEAVSSETSVHRPVLQLYQINDSGHNFKST